MKRLLIALVLLLIGYFIFCYTSPKLTEQSIISIRKNTKATISSASSLSTPEQSRTEQLRSLIEFDNAPIEFYGLVVDENGSPLSDVEVSWDVIKSGSFAPSLGLPTRANGIIRTNALGKFSVKETGSSLSIGSLIKMGYRQGRQMQGSYGYGSKSEPYQPDEVNPERFLMVVETTQASVKLNIPLKFNWDGLPKEFEIGPKEFLCKIILIPTREPLKSDDRIHSWKLVIKSKDGQLILGKNGDAPLAPVSGYEDDIILQRDIDGQRGSKADALIYLKVDSGKYAEFRISAYSDRGLEDSAAGYIDVRWNPDGGRVFE